MEMLNLKKLYELMAIRNVKNVYELSKAVKIPYTTLSYMVKGHDMHVSSLVEIAHFFNVPIDDLIGKHYGITVVSDDKEILCSTTNIYEATMSSMM